MTIKDIKEFAKFINDFSTNNIPKSKDILDINESKAQMSSLINIVKNASTSSDVAKKTKALSLLANENYQLETIETSLSEINLEKLETKYKDNIRSDTFLKNIMEKEKSFVNRLTVFNQLHTEKSLIDAINEDKTIGDVSTISQSILEAKYCKLDGTEQNTKEVFNLDSEDKFKELKLKKFIELETKALTEYFDKNKSDLDKSIEKFQKDEVILNNKTNEAKKILGKAARMLKDNKTELELKIDETTNNKELHSMIQYDIDDGSSAKSNPGVSLPLWLVIVIILVTMVIALIIIILIKKSASKQIQKIEEKAALAVQAQE